MVCRFVAEIEMSDGTGHYHLVLESCVEAQKSHPRKWVDYYLPLVKKPAESLVVPLTFPRGTS